MDQLIIFCAKYLFIAVVALWWLAWLQAPRKYKKILTLATLIASILAVVLDKIASDLYYDPRPFVSQHITPLVNHAADNGFPSEHTLFSMTLAAILVFYRPKLGAAAVLVALLVGAGRMGAHVHSPIDIIGSIIFAWVSAYIGYKATQIIVARYLKSKS